MSDPETADAHTRLVLNNLIGRELKPDVLAVVSAGHHLNVEMQRTTEIRKPGKRSQYYGALLMTTNTPTGADFTAVPGVYVICIAEEDFGGRGTSLYENVYRQKSGEELPGTTHIVFINGACRDTSTETGKIINGINNPGHGRTSPVRDRSQAVSTYLSGTQCPDTFQSAPTQILRRPRREHFTRRNQVVS